jgi:predicted DNA-binding antitoxin AbrB/MazE fold protein
MSTSVEAIYENGVFRPVQRVDLAEGTRVEVIVIARESPPRKRTPAEIAAEIAAMDVESDSEGFSGRDHDQILYGERGAR